MSQTARPEVDALRAAALAALERPLDRKKTPGVYRLSLILVSVFMVALPLIYLAFVVATAWGVFWYATHGYELVAGWQFARARSLAYGGPLVVGAVVVFFLLKPFLARAPKGPEPFTLDPDAEPFLHEFVEELARRLGARVPHRIDVDLAVNASASFAHGLSSLFSGKLALTLGLPLISNLSLRELTGVLAHEFGHFSQGAGMRCYYLIQRVNHWFARVVFQRDSWDLRLESWARSGWFFAIVVFNVARACVWLSRKLLYGLLLLGARATSLMSRQMEFDADQNAIRLCGSDSFSDAMRALPLIEVASHWARATNEAAYREGRLVADYPALVEVGLGEIPEETRTAVLEQAMASTVDMYASHPPTEQRIARAVEAGQPGVFDVVTPSSVLFEDYEGLCSEVTADGYGGAVPEEGLVPVDQVVEGRAAVERGVGSMMEYFLGQPLGPTSLALEDREPERPAHPREALKRLEEVRQAVIEEMPASLERHAKRQEIEAKIEKARSGEAFRRASKPAGKGVGASPSAPSPAEKRGQQALDELRAADATLHAAFRERVALGMDLFSLPEVQRRVEGAAGLLERGSSAARVLARLPAVSDAIHELRGQMEVMGDLATRLEGQEEAVVQRSMTGQLRLLRERLEALHAGADGLGYPYEHGRGAIGLAEYLIPELPSDERSLNDHWLAAQGAMTAWSHLLTRLLGELSEVLLEAERAMQLPPLELATRAGAEG